MSRQSRIDGGRRAWCGRRGRLDHAQQAGTLQGDKRRIDPADIARNAGVMNLDPVATRRSTKCRRPLALDHDTDLIVINTGPISHIHLFRNENGRPLRCPGDSRSFSGLQTRGRDGRSGHRKRQRGGDQDHQRQAGCQFFVKHTGSFRHGSRIILRPSLEKASRGLWPYSSAPIMVLLKPRI